MTTTTRGRFCHVANRAEMGTVNQLPRVLSTWQTDRNAEGAGGWMDGARGAAT